MYTLILTLKTPHGCFIHSVPGFPTFETAHLAGTVWAGEAGSGLSTARFSVACLFGA